MRPHEKPYVRLPLLGAQSKALETCTYCPKLCRTVCPVSNAVPKETWTPGVKVSFAYHMARGDVPLRPDAVETAYACTGCGACSESCDHKNPVASILQSTRSELYQRGYAPASITAARKAFDERETKAEARDAAAKGRYALAGGCAYSAEIRAQALHVARHILGTQDVVWIEQCCGRPLAAMGDAKGFAVQEARHRAERSKYERVFSIDAGCSETLLVHGVPMLLERALASVTRFAQRSHASEIRYHDACAMGRGLGHYAMPRTLLRHLTGGAPSEFLAKEAQSACSGGGALVPVTLPEVARRTAQERVNEHESLGGGTIVTTCASSLRSFKRAGHAAIDIVELLAERIEPAPALEPL